MADEQQVQVANSRIDRLNRLVGRAVAWLTLAMIVVTFVVVVMRYAFDAGLIWMQESVVWMHAAVFMLGAGYTLQQEDHVRVDIFYRGMGERRRALVDVLGVLLFLWPLCVYLFASGWGFVAASWSIREASRESGGLPYPFIPLLKTVILVMPVLLGLQGLARLLRCIATLRGPGEDG